MRVVLLIFCLAIAFPVDSVVLAQAEQASQSGKGSISRTEVRSLVTQLGSSSRVARGEAEKKLKSLGPGILDLLPPPDLIRSVAARQAVRRIRVHLEQQAARVSVKPAPVTLSGEFDINEILKSIEEQTGNRVQQKGEPDPRKISITWKNKTFWSALSELESQGWISQFENTRGELVISREPLPPSITQIEGAIRIRSASLQRKPIDGVVSLLQSRLTIECEPRLRPLFLNYSSDDFSLSSEERVSPPFNSGAKVELPLGLSGRRAVIQPRFIASDELKAASVTGKVTLLLAAAERPIEFSPVGKSAGVARRRGGVTVVISKVEASEQNGLYSGRVQIRVNYDLGETAFESHQTWVFHNRVWLTNSRKEATRIAPSSFETIFQNDTGVGIEYVFSGLRQSPGSMRFVYMAPTQLIRVPIKIDLKQIPVSK